MFNTNIGDFGSINCGSLEFAESAIDFDDLSFLQLIMCMQESDRFLAAKMKEIRAMNAIKRNLTEQISRLSNFLARSSAKEDDDFVYIEGGLDKPVDTTTGPDPYGDAQKEIEQKWNDLEKQFVFGAVDASSSQKKRDAARANLLTINDQAANGHIYRKSVVVAKIEELRGKLEDYDSSSSVMMIDLQRLMNKRNEAVQLVSNIESRSHKTAMSIISNFS